MISITQALKQLAELSGENALLVADPKEGLFVVIRYEDDKQRLAFCREKHEPKLKGNALALFLIRKAIRYQKNAARARIEMGRAVRLATLEAKLDEVLSGKC